MIRKIKSNPKVKRGMSVRIRKAVKDVKNVKNQTKMTKPSK